MSSSSGVADDVGILHVQGELRGADGNERADARTSPSWVPVASHDGIRETGQWRRGYRDEYAGERTDGADAGRPRSADTESDAGGASRCVSGWRIAVDPLDMEGLMIRHRPWLG